MATAGRTLAGYLAAVSVVATLLAAAVSGFGQGPAKSGVEFWAFSGKILWASLVALAPIYGVTRLILWLVSIRSPVVFTLAFILACVVIFAGLAQVLDTWMIDWDSEPADLAKDVVEHKLAALLWGGYNIGPLFFTGFGIVFWCLAGAGFGLVVWCLDWIGARRAVKLPSA